jgi:hypothetical protein
MSGWIKMHRQFLDWEWYSDINTRLVFIHLLLEANWEDSSYRGDDIPMGYLVTGRDILAVKVGLSVQKIRTALNNLESTNDITIKTSRKGTVIQIVNYQKYQNLTNKQPETNQITSPEITTLKKLRNKETHLYAPREVEELFLEELKMYPKALNDFDIKTFNNLNLDDKKIIAKFASSMGKIWNDHRGEKNINLVTKFENLIKMYLSNEKFITSTDAVKQVLKIEYKKENKMPTYQDMVAAGKIKI